MKKIILGLFAFGLLLIAAIAAFKPASGETDNLEKLREKYSRKPVKSVDHSKFAQLQGKFENPRQLTAACISCHNGRHTEVMHSNHWNWERPEYEKGKGIVYIGKKNAVNNFCIGVQGNEKSCAKCHIGLGETTENNKLNYVDSTNIDCLVCHDNSETYAKGQELEGAPDPKVDLAKAAQSVGKPKRSNCGVCHFFGGGGNNVKHGDLEKSLFEPSKELDAHMAVEGMNMECTDCHVTQNHVISGKMYSLSSMNRNRVTCEQCHTETPHDKDILNEHTLKVACQTCHIPTYAKDAATKVAWDWSTAGRLRDGKPYEEDDAFGNHTYLSIKGTFKWAKNLKPEYAWFNGTATHYLLGEKIPDYGKKTLELNPLYGDYADPDAKIIPLKRHRARQPADPVNQILIQPKLYADNPGEGAFWKDFNWQRASEVGMKEAGLPYSGKYDFIETVMNWPVNHMVGTKENTVKCVECHTQNGSRLAGLNDFYMPARDRNGIVETSGIAIIIMTLIGVAGHGAMRIFSSRKNKGN